GGPIFVLIYILFVVFVTKDTELFY
ncbi:MAG: hypothetical protein Q620_VSAC00660G0001, partial [Veillonella sp. DORA_A_3_16_22]